MLKQRADEMAPDHEPSAEIVGRVQRRRTTKMVGLGTAALAVVVAIGAVVVQGSSGTKKPAISVIPPTAVSVVGCSGTAAVSEDSVVPAPSDLPASFTPAYGDQSDVNGLTLFAGGRQFDNRLAVLGPKDWKCVVREGGDGSGSLYVVPSDVKLSDVQLDYTGARIEIQFAYNGPGLSLACPYVGDSKIREGGMSVGSPCQPQNVVVTQITDVMSSVSDGTMQGVVVGSADVSKASTFMKCGNAGLVPEYCDTVAREYIARNVKATNGLPGATSGPLYAVPRVFCPGDNVSEDVTVEVSPYFGVKGDWSVGDRPDISNLRAYWLDGAPITVAPAGWECDASAGKGTLEVRPLVENSGGGAALVPLVHMATADLTSVSGPDMACAFFTADAIKAAGGPSDLTCPTRETLPGRTITSSGPSMAFFTDGDGSSGFASLKPNVGTPGSRVVPGTSVSVFSCRPGAGLTAADCDVIKTAMSSEYGVNGP
ncbi:MAG TPA: hypothetical protein VFR41_15135 [Acidimicrobiia bacterium]|nr:hypothetical protein [Acidimicrobiia bacterium]